MRRVLFHYPVLNTGGAEMSSLRMIKALADRGWSITLVLTTGGGALEAAVDPRVRVVRLRPRAYGNRFLAARGVPARLCALPDLLAYAATRVVGALRMLPFMFRYYDAAAVLLMGTSSSFVRRVVRAPVRVQWIRSDLSGADPTGRIARALREAEPGLDRFVCVSEVSRQSLLTAVPSAAGKTEVIYNILAADAMRARARDGSDPFPARKNGVLRILTVCRLSDQAKGLLRMVRVCRKLVDAGYTFSWFVVGDGSDRAMIERAIEDAGLSERMILMGGMPNPFPAYINADLVAMLSYYEGLCGVVNEARVLERPVIATRVSGIEEQLIGGVSGLVVENDEEAIFDGLSKLINDHTLRDRLARGGYPAALLDDAVKLERLEAIFLPQGAA